MKSFILSLCFIIYHPLLFANGDRPCVFPAAELIIYLDQQDVNNTYTITAQSKVWVDSLGTYKLTTAYNSLNYTPNTSQYGDQSQGFNFHPCPISDGLPTFGYGYIR
jgi:hypothetical protein